MSTATYVPEQTMQRAAMLAWAIGLNAVTSEALAERDQVPAVIARERLDEAVSMGLLNRQSVLVDYPALYTVTPAGRKLARKHAPDGGYVYPMGLRMPRVNIATARHTIACAGVMAALERRYPGHRVIGESELHRDERKRKRKIATVDILGTGGRRVHSPDIVIWPPATQGTPDTPNPPDVPVPPGEMGPAPLPVAVEVELSSKRKEELMENLRAWARCRTIEAVLYYAETRKIEEALLDGIEYLKAEKEIVVNPLSAILEPLPGFPLTDD
jgi:hypothetical protein